MNKQCTPQVQAQSRHCTQTEAVTASNSANCLLPCRLLSASHACAARPVGNLFECGACGGIGQAIRGLPEQPKALAQPENIRRLLFELMTSGDAGLPPFALMTIGGSHFDELPGIGPTRLDHPCEIKLSQLDGDQGAITIRWGELVENAAARRPVAHRPADEDVAAMPLFQQLAAKFDKLGLKFVTLATPGYHLFTGRFKQPGNEPVEYGVSVMLSLARDRIMRKLSGR